ncbi:MAG: hypothetical protein IKE43_00615 [Coriobacteriales bacterium]|nr:hypothetical protein [Coriobacteriales bacterium]
MRKILAASVSLVLALALLPGAALAAGNTTSGFLGSKDKETTQSAAQIASSASSDKKDDEAAQKAKEKAQALEDTLKALNNDVYSNTLKALKNGEVLSEGSTGDTAAGVQQTLADLGYPVEINGVIGPDTIEYLNSFFGVLGIAPVQSIDANAYEQLLPPILIVANQTEADKILDKYYETTKDTSQYAYMKACIYYLQGKYYNAKESFEKSKYGNYKERAEACIQPWPGYGELWHNDYMYSGEMLLTFVVNSPNEERGMLFMVYTDDGILASVMFVTGTSTISTYLPGGIYRIKNASGYEWYGMDQTFGRNGSYEYMKFNEFEDVYRTDLPAGYEWQITVNATEIVGSPVDPEQTDWGSWSENL